MTLQDAENFRLRLARQGDADGAEKVGTLIVALVQAADDRGERTADEYLIAAGRAE